MNQRSLRELVEVAEPAWPEVQRWIAEAARPLEVLPASEYATEVLEDLQVSLASALGAIAYYTGGLLIDDGWIRVLGSGGDARLSRSIREWNRGKPPGVCLVADDVVGGFFGVDTGGLGIGDGQAAYFAPDSLSWEALGMGYSAMLRWMLAGDIDLFYRDVRRSGWQEAARLVGGDRAWSFAPPLWTVEGQDLSRVSRRSVPIEEVWGLHIEWASQLRPRDK